MNDTVALAKKEREKEGSWEIEFSYGGEADLHKHFVTCDKNPDHQKFIPVDQFNVDHIPTCYRNQDIVDYVKHLAVLTVRVSVTYVSEKRPETVRGSNKPYPSYSHRGSNMMRVGSGWVAAVDIFPHFFGKNRSCECKECLNSPTPLEHFAEVSIRTAAHVVYDELEAEHTTCHLFFDKGGTPQKSSGVVTLTGMKLMCSFDFTDYCDLLYITHDLDLAHRLKMSDDQCKFLYKKLSRHQLGSIPDAWNTVTVIVSHPHGCSKQVSVGHSTNSKDRTNDNDKFIYNTATCPGSSGACVFVLGNTTNSWATYSHVHSGNMLENKELNFSGVGSRTLPIP